MHCINEIGMSGFSAVDWRPRRSWKRPRPIENKWTITPAELQVRSDLMTKSHCSDVAFLPIIA